jgi:HK97 gp10 family phage protein
MVTMAKVKYEIEGMKELEKTIRKLGKLPQKCVTKAAKKGAQIALKAAKQKAPFLTGALEEGIILKGEKTRRKGKKVYQVTMNPAMNDVFVKTTKDGKRYYYPASQEYGFITKNGGYVPGYHYLRDSLVDNKERIEKTVVDVLAKEIDKLR